MTKDVKALRFTQWMPEWDELKFNEKEHRRQPGPHMYLFSMPASRLRLLCGVFRRQRQDGVAVGIQRGHDAVRSELIRDFVRYGYPYSEMSPARRKNLETEYQDLRKPGWLPTAIVINILGPDDERLGKKVAEKDLVRILDHDDGSCLAQLPEAFTSPDWEPESLAPLEVIDGQHRLYAFDRDLSGEFELPVVAFSRLDLGWQAYLFWSINVSPKKINPSHAFDLYPLLRSQDWLEKFAESNVYREARAQELTDFLYRHPSSPWANRINMLGERGKRGVTQAAWVRALTSTFLASGHGKGTKGLFGCSVSDTIGPLPWTRPQQAAFLIQLWSFMRDEVAHSSEPWVIDLRSGASKQRPLELEGLDDQAFLGSQTMLNQEQGMRGLLSVANEIFFAAALQLGLDKWEPEVISELPETEIAEAIETLNKMPFIPFMAEFAKCAAKFDWRSADAESLQEKEKLMRRAFRGSGGYAALRDELLKHLSSCGGAIGDWALAVANSRR